MELYGVLVLALVTCVTCTPHGYGVKSGAVAKAEANAASGAFGGVLPVIPLSIPSGGGYTGSFSKSSSSSFASSSASSSSSSSSFSYGGTASNGLAGNSIPSSLHITPTAHDGFGASGSIAQVATGASAIAGSSALSHNVGNTNNKCSSNNCDLNSHQHNINDNKNCLSGQCQPSSNLPNNYEANLQTANSPSIQQQTDLDDFEVNIGGKSKPSINLSHGYKPGFDDKGQKDCSYGKCGTKINEASHNVPATYHNVNPSKKNCNSPGSGCDIFIPLAPSGNAASTNLQQPDIHLTAPNIEPACSSHDCNPGLTSTNSNNEKPTSYNVPILGGNYNGDTQATKPLYDLPSGAPKIPSYSDGIYSSQLPSNPAVSSKCVGPNCDSLNNPAYQSPSNPSCNTPNCGVNPVSSGPSAQAGYTKPGTVPALTQTSFGASGSGSNSGHNSAFSGHHDGSLKPNYNNPTANSGSLNGVAHPGSLETPKINVFSGSQNTQGYTSGFGTSGVSIYDLNKGTKPTSNIVPSSQNIPLYTGGFGGAAGSFDTHTGSHFQSKPTNESPSHVPSTIPHDTGITAGPGHGINDSNKGIKPTSNIAPSSQNIPLYTGSFGGSAGSFDTHTGSHFQSKPTHENPSPGPSTIPHDTGITAGPGHGIHDSNNGIKPTSNIAPSSQNIPLYTGSFGGSAGSFDTHTGSHFQPKPTKENPSPGPSTIPHDTGITAGPGHGIHDSNKGIKQTSDIAPSSQNIPLYTGSFGGSVGSFDTHTGSHFQPKPTNENPSPGPTTIPHDTGITAGLGHGSLTLPKPASSLHSGHGTSSGQADIHSGVGSLDKPHPVGGAPVPGLHGAFGINPVSGVGSSQQKIPIYTGGFGGSPGSFVTGSKIGTYYASKQSHDKIPSDSHITPSSGHHTGSGLTTNTGSNLSYEHETQKSESLIPVNTGTPNSGYFAGASNGLQPGLVKPVDEKTKLPPYLGGFGGPSGILKPNEYSVGHTPCVSANCGSPIAHNGGNGKANIFSSGASSGSSASANTKTAGYSGSFGGPPGLFKPFNDDKSSKTEHDGHTENILTGEYDKSSSGINSEYSNTPVSKDSDEHKASSDFVNKDNSGANANAAAFASSNALSANQGLSSSGCNSGCSSNYDSGTGGSFSSSLGSSNTGALGGSDSLVGSIASANIVAGAGAGLFGAGRSFASSSASAHASAGAAVKGGYGRR